MNLRDENRKSVMQYFGYDPGRTLRLSCRTVNCVHMDVRCGALSRSVTVCPLKTQFINSSAAILMYFLNTTLRFSAITE